MNTRYVIQHHEGVYFETESRKTLVLMNAKWFYTHAKGVEALSKTKEIGKVLPIEVKVAILGE